MRGRFLAGFTLAIGALFAACPTSAQETPGESKPAAGRATNRASPFLPGGPGEALRPSGDAPAGLLPGLTPPANRPATPMFLNPKPVVGDAPAPAAAREATLAPGEADWRISAAPPDSAFGAYQRGLYVTALREALDRVSKDAEDPISATAAMTLIGEIYRDGLGVKQDWIAAARWYQLAYSRGDPQAAFALARAYLEGSGVLPDKVAARKYFEQAAAKNHAGALYNLGVMAIEGDIQDYGRAANYFRRAADLGHLDALYSLAFLHRSGEGVAKDEERATAILRDAADQHHLPAMVDYAIALFNGRGVTASEEGAARYLIRAAWRNAPVAQNRLARMYLAGRGVKSDMVEAMKWHVLASANGLKDPWLDGKMRELSQTQRELVDEAVRKFGGK